jgi:hypothetical protein
MVAEKSTGGRTDDKIIGGSSYYKVECVAVLVSGRRYELREPVGLDKVEKIQRSSIRGALNMVIKVADDEETGSG